ncbi:MAG: hypothetical protein KAT68_14465 [Bacteroidales bacterium]|nr:hypothetical protein [Bacteroidales bacterium]
MKNILLTLLFLFSLNIMNVFSQTNIVVSLVKSQNKSINGGQLYVWNGGYATNGSYYSEERYITTNDETLCYPTICDYTYMYINIFAKIDGYGFTGWKHKTTAADPYVHSTELDVYINFFQVPPKPVDFVPATED